MGSNASVIVGFIVPYFFFMSLYVFSVKLSYRRFSTIVYFFCISHYILQLRSLKQSLTFPCQSTSSCSGKVNKFHSLLQNLKQSVSAGFFNCKQSDPRFDRVHVHLSGDPFLVFQSTGGMREHGTGSNGICRGYFTNQPWNNPRSATMAEGQP